MTGENHIADQSSVSEEKCLSQAVSAWLEYKSLIGLKKVLNESSMAVPISEFLAARHGGEIRSEVAHPLFKKEERGRPKQLDFVRVKSGKKTWHSVYECKYSNTNQRLVVADICRLALLTAKSGVGNPGRYFVFAGEIQAGGTLISKKFNTGNGPRLQFFDSILGQGDANEGKLLTVRVRDLEENQRAMFRTFAKENSTPIPSVFTTELKGWSVRGDYGCAVWRVVSKSGAKLVPLEEV